MDIADFIRARLDEDEQAARAATPGPWTVDSDIYPEAINSPSGDQPVAGGRWGGEASVFETAADAVHIARHDPARVLAEVAAKRRILGWANSPALPPQESFYVLDALATVWAEHPDFREDWEDSWEPKW